MANNLFTPSPGFAQSQYFDQIATALPGQLANASDYNLVDSYVVDPSVGPMGLVAGLAVRLLAAVAGDVQRPGINEGRLGKISAAGQTVFGISVRNQQMDSNVDGDACWFGGRMANVLRLDRVGGRIWVRLAEGITPAMGAAVYVVPATGLFTNVATDMIQVPGASWHGTATAGDKLGLVEVGRR